MRVTSAKILFLAFCAAASYSQEVIHLPVNPGPKTAPESYPEQEYFSKTWNTEIVANVTQPTLTVYRPLPWTANGAAIVVCPGGGFMALSIHTEGIDAAEWLAAKGFTTFVLRYRLAHTHDDAAKEFQQIFHDKRRLEETLSPVVPLSFADGLEALRYVRKHASEWNISPDKVGILGFSAGGSVAADVALHYTPDARPAFAAPIYAAASMLKADPVPSDAPPLFVAAATDDSLGLTGDTLELYEKWIAAHKPAELHVFAKGGHGFGMRKQQLPSDGWIDRFWDWLQQQGFAGK